MTAIILAMCGVGLVAAGLFLIYVPAALIFVGLIFLATGLMADVSTGKGS